MPNQSLTYGCGYFLTSNGKVQYMIIDEFLPLSLSYRVQLAINIHDLYSVSSSQKDSMVIIQIYKYTALLISHCTTNHTEATYKLVFYLKKQ